MEADETYVGGKRKGTGVKDGMQAKTPVFSLLQRGGRVLSFAMPRVTGKNLKQVIRENVDKQATIMTDSFIGYRGLKYEFAGHEMVDHSRDEWVRGNAYANTVEIRDGVLTGELLGPILDGPGKARILREIAAREGVRPDQVVGVGDGANDIPMLQAAGLGIAFRAKEGTRRRADAAIQRNDFMGLLYLLGVSGRDLRRMRQESTGDTA